MERVEYVLESALRKGSPQQRNSGVHEGASARNSSPVAQSSQELHLLSTRCIAPLICQAQLPLPPRQQHAQLRASLRVCNCVRKEPQRRCALGGRTRRRQRLERLNKCRPRRARPPRVQRYRHAAQSTERSEARAAHELAALLDGCRPPHPQRPPQPAHCPRPRARSFVKGSRHRKLGARAPAINRKASCACVSSRRCSRNEKIQRALPSRIREPRAH